jgi:hypothetical protein
MVLQLQRLGILTLQPLQIVYCVCVGMHTDVFGMLCGCVGVHGPGKRLPVGINTWSLCRKCDYSCLCHHL